MPMVTLWAMANVFHVRLCKQASSQELNNNKQIQPKASCLFVQLSTTMKNLDKVMARINDVLTM
ncbi:CLUMA_CG007226, isoform A [Clunio marinus]|uniref:CLUMA_CG007226, isoform A n=1 Tax=Clunio marinus TaxID=568069 RepID=A0A1J1I1R8_9DIPT|nr:CLUMA_CG007226, isoform A [Clunio marinus]